MYTSKEEISMLILKGRLPDLHWVDASEGLLLVVNRSIFILSGSERYQTSTWFYVDEEPYTLYCPKEAWEHYTMLKLPTDPEQLKKLELFPRAKGWKY